MKECKEISTHECECASVDNLSSNRNQTRRNGDPCQREEIPPATLRVCNNFEVANAPGDLMFHEKKQLRRDSKSLHGDSNARAILQAHATAMQSYCRREVLESPRRSPGSQGCKADATAPRGNDATKLRTKIFQCHAALDSADDPCNRRRATQTAGYLSAATTH